MYIMRAKFYVITNMGIKCCKAVEDEEDDELELEGIYNRIFSCSIKI